MALKLHTWTRVTRIELQNLAVNIGKAAIADINNWPDSGEGRAVKAATERMMRLLDSTLDRSGLDYAFGNLHEVVHELKGIEANSYFRNRISRQRHVEKGGGVRPFDEIVADQIARFNRFVQDNRPTLDNDLGKSEPISDDRSPPTVRRARAGAVEELSRITPGQQAGPLQFEIRDGVLRIKEQTAFAVPEDRDNVAHARRALEDSADALLVALSESNCDPRLIEAVEEIQKIIVSGADVIRLGLVNFTCDHLFIRFAEEIPDVAAARFQGFSMGIGLYVAQFPEWLRFTENAAKADVEADDVNRTLAVGHALIPELRSATGLIDPQVPKSIELILEALRNPNQSSRRALYGAIRTLENLFAKIFAGFGGIIGSVSDGVNAGTKRATSIIVTTGLLVGAAHLAASLSPTAERVVKANWLKHAAELVKNGLKEAE
ncbi:hypothetical protein [Sphingopyxis sp. 22461]|uniref:hypothetical protein n=1 Tax=Sphingopyxis sp. 22461 TaxID=3453923 RepID=UPI003F87FE31